MIAELIIGIVDIENRATICLYIARQFINFYA